ncbi:MAG: N,N-dimethylformamidase beta subunit family domain-containing protein [Verrucomicrobiota bacterium]
MKTITSKNAEASSVRFPKAPAGQSPSGVTRRKFIGQTTAVGAAAFLLPRLARAQDGARPLFIEGYAGQVSYAPGDEVTLHISTSAPKFTLEIARLGLKPEILWKTPSPVPGAEHAIPEAASSLGCAWPVALRVKIPADWRSGYYQVTLRASDHGGKFVQRGSRRVQSDCFFVVHSATPGRDTNILLQLTTNTYNAYNNWGGTSLYGYNGRGNVQGHRVSFERPPESQFGNWELPFVQWAERNGYQLDYAVNTDREFNPDLLKHYRLGLSVGHDEYWSAPMRDHLEKFIRDGGNVAFFSGNTCCWQVRSEDGGRALTCWKEYFHKDPGYPTGDHRLLTSLWSHHLVQRPENQLTGVCFLWDGFHRSHEQFMDGSGAFTVHRPDHWIFEGTGLKRGDEFGGKDSIVGYECDGCELTWRNGLCSIPGPISARPALRLVCASPTARVGPDPGRQHDRTTLHAPPGPGRRAQLLDRRPGLRLWPFFPE